jgi:hypothetical protein
MDPVRGAGQRATQDFIDGKMRYVPEHRSFRNPNNQEFFITDSNRIMRFDGDVKQYNVYDAKQREFIPCEPANNEKVQDLDMSSLRRALIAEQAWSDYLLDKGSKFTFGAGRSLAFSMGAGIAGGLVGPVAKKVFNKAGEAIVNNSKKVVRNVPPVPAGILNNSHAIHMHLPPGAAPIINGEDGCVHFPSIPDCIQIRNPIRLPWDLNVKDIAIHGAGSAIGVAAGAAVGGPIGGAVGGAIAAGIGAIL